MGAALAVVAAVAVATGAVLTLALKALSSERRAGEQKARADSLDVNLTGLAAQLADMTNQHNEERQRADRLYRAMLDSVAAGPVAGSYQRLLEALSAAAAESGDGARVVHPPAATIDGRDTDLLDPSSESD